MALLVVARHGEGRDAHVALVEVGHEPLDRAALARRVPALHEDAHRGPELAIAELAAELEPQRAEPLLRGLEALVLLLARQLQREVELVEAAHARTLTFGTWSRCRRVRWSPRRALAGCGCATAASRS